MYTEATQVKLVRHFAVFRMNDHITYELDNDSIYSPVEIKRVIIKLVLRSRRIGSSKFRTILYRCKLKLERERRRSCKWYEDQLHTQCLPLEPSHKSDLSRRRQRR